MTVAQEIHNHLVAAEEHAYRLDLFTRIGQAMERGASLNDAIGNELQAHQQRMQQIFGHPASQADIVNEIRYAATAQRVIDVENRFVENHNLQHPENEIKTTYVRTPLVHRDDAPSQHKAKFEHVHELALERKCRDISESIPDVDDVRKATEFATVQVRHHTQEVWATDQKTRPVSRAAEIGYRNRNSNTGILHEQGNQFAHIPPESRQPVAALPPGDTATAALAGEKFAFAVEMRKRGEPLRRHPAAAEPFSRDWPTPEQLRILKLKQEKKELVQEKTGLNRARDELISQQEALALDREKLAATRDDISAHATDAQTEAALRQIEKIDTQLSGIDNTLTDLDKHAVKLDAMLGREGQNGRLGEAVSDIDRHLNAKSPAGAMDATISEAQQLKAELEPLKQDTRAVGKQFDSINRETRSLNRDVEKLRGSGHLPQPGVDDAHGKPSRGSSALSAFGAAMNARQLVENIKEGDVTHASVAAAGLSGSAADIAAKLKFAPAISAASGLVTGGSDLVEGIKDGDAEKIVSGAITIGGSAVQGAAVSGAVSGTGVLAARVVPVVGIAYSGYTAARDIHECYELKKEADRSFEEASESLNPQTGKSAVRPNGRPVLNLSHYGNMTHIALSGKESLHPSNDTELAALGVKGFQDPAFIREQLNQERERVGHLPDERGFFQKLISRDPRELEEKRLRSAETEFKEYEQRFNKWSGGQRPQTPGTSPLAQTEPDAMQKALEAAHESGAIAQYQRGITNEPQIAAVPSRQHSPAQGRA